MIELWVTAGTDRAELADAIAALEKALRVRTVSSPRDRKDGRGVAVWVTADGPQTRIPPQERARIGVPEVIEDPAVSLIDYQREVAQALLARGLGVDTGPLDPNSTDQTLVLLLAGSTDSAGIGDDAAAVWNATGWTYVPPVLAEEASRPADLGVIPMPGDDPAPLPRRVADWLAPLHQRWTAHPV